MTLIFSLILSFTTICYGLPIRLSKTLLLPLARFQLSLHYVIVPLHPPYCKYSLCYFISIHIPLEETTISVVPLWFLSYVVSILTPSTWLFFRHWSPYLSTLSQFTFGTPHLNCAPQHATLSQFTFGIPHLNHTHWHACMYMISYGSPYVALASPCHLC